MISCFTVSQKHLSMYWIKQTLLSASRWYWYDNKFNYVGGIYIVALLAINSDSQNNSLAIAIIQHLQRYQWWPCQTLLFQHASIEGFRHCYIRFDRTKGCLSFPNRLDSNGRIQDFLDFGYHPASVSRDLALEVHTARERKDFSEFWHGVTSQLFCLPTPYVGRLGKNLNNPRQLHVLKCQHTPLYSGSLNSKFNYRYHGDLVTHMVIHKHTVHVWRTQDQPNANKVRGAGSFESWVTRSITDGVDEGRNQRGGSCQCLWNTPRPWIGQPVFWGCLFTSLKWFGSPIQHKGADSEGDGHLTIKNFTNVCWKSC